MRHIFKNRRSGRFGLLGSLVAVVAVAFTLGLIPRATALYTSAEQCVNPPTKATLNYWPVTYTNTTNFECKDFPAVDAGKYNPNGDTNFSQDEADWNNGLNLEMGDTGVALMYVHNGAANNLPKDDTRAKNVRVVTSTSSTTGPNHQISVSFKGDNTNTVSKTFTVHTPSNAKLEVVANSGKMFNYQAQPIASGLNLGNSTYTIGDMNACFEYSVFLSFRFKVVKGEDVPTDSNLSIDKEVRNLTTNSGFASSVRASQNDRLEYRVKVRNTGNSTARTVAVTDNGVSGISIDSGSTTVDNSEFQRGSFPGTVNLGDLRSGETATITYKARITKNDDNCVTLTNTVRAQADNTGSVSDTAQVRLDNCGGGGGGDKDITIRKQVRLHSSDTYRDQIDAKRGDRVQFKITVTNNGNDGTVRNVEVTDIMPSDMDYRQGSFDGDGDDSFRNRTLSVDLGEIREDDSKTFEFEAEVTTNDERRVCNTARADGDDVDQVSDQACVNVDRQSSGGGSARIEQSKRAHNDTKNRDATTTNADRGDVITFTLTTTNIGNATKRDYDITDDLSGVLPLVDIVDLNGGKLSGNTLTYEDIDIREDQTVTKTFKVRVKSSLSPSLSYQIRNTYGNTVYITVPGQVIYEAPKTGSNSTSAAVFAGLITATAVIVRRGKDIFNFIFA